MVALLQATFTFWYMVLPKSLWMIPVKSQYPSFWKCGFLCYTNEYCGGFQYVPTWNTKCYLMVHKLAPGCRLLPLNIAYTHKMVDFQDGAVKLYELPTMSQTFAPARQDCLDRGMELVPFPISPRDEITLSLTKHKCFWVDLQRQADGSYSDARGERQLAAGDLGIAWASGEPTGGSEACLVLCIVNGGFELQDRPCSGSTAMAVHCVM